MAKNSNDSKVKLGFFKFIDWYYKLVILNFTFLLFTIMGGVLFGIAPSIKASQYMIMRWLKKEEPPIIKTFWSIYKEDFLYTYLTFLPFLIGILLFSWTSSLAFRYLRGTIMILSIGGSILFLFIFVTGLFFVYSLKNRYQIGYLSAIRYSFRIPFKKIGYLLVIWILQLALFCSFFFLWAYLIFLNFGFSFFITEFFLNKAVKNIDPEKIRDKTDEELDFELLKLERELDQEKKEKIEIKKERKKIRQEYKQMKKARKQAKKELREEEKAKKNDCN